MLNGPKSLASLRDAIRRLPPKAEHWIEIQEKLNLCKLTSSDLANEFESARVAEIVTALNQQDVGPLGQELGVTLETKFRVFASRQPDKCKIRCQGSENAKWMRGYLRSRFKTTTVTAPQAVKDTPLFRVDVTLDADATVFSVRQALLECPAALLVQMFDVRVHEQPHFRISVENLAAWLEGQGEEPWWTVDGDTYLMSRLEFPAPSDELAGELRQIGRGLLIADPNANASGEELTPEEVDGAVEADEWGNRMLTLTWENGDSDWQLVEEEELTSESSGL